MYKFHFQCFKNIPKKEFVYGWCRKGIYLYIGYTQNGVSRFIGHHVLTKNILLGTDVFHLWYGELNLSSLEKQLIQKYLPIYNKQQYVKTLTPLFEAPTPNHIFDIFPRCRVCNIVYTPTGRGIIRSCCSYKCHKILWNSTNRLTRRYH